MPDARAHRHTGGGSGEIGGDSDDSGWETVDEEEGDGEKAGGEKAGVDADEAGEGEKEKEKAKA